MTASLLRSSIPASSFTTGGDMKVLEETAFASLALPTALLGLSLVGARARQRVPHGVVALVAGVLEYLVARIALEWERDLPRARPGLRIGNRDLVLNRIRAGAREALGQFQRVAREHQLAIRLQPVLSVEIRCAHDERLALPAAA